MARGLGAILLLLGICGFAYIMNRWVVVEAPEFSHELMPADNGVEMPLPSVVWIVATGLSLQLIVIGISLLVSGSFRVVKNFLRPGYYLTFKRKIVDLGKY